MSIERLCNESWDFGCPKDGQGPALADESCTGLLWLAKNTKVEDACSALPEEVVSIPGLKLWDLPRI